MGEGGYYLTSLEAAISHVKDVDPSSSSGMFKARDDSDSDDSDNETVCER